jgi:uncharacterized repeat protein (TIGR04138 family)
MTTVKNRRTKRAFHPHAYQFVFSALRFTQQQLGRSSAAEATGHISGRELLDGVRLLGLQHFGMMAIPVFRNWGIRSTDDIGRIVFELIERGEMRKTEDDRLTDFFGVYDFEKVFRDEYAPDISVAFS